MSDSSAKECLKVLVSGDVEGKLNDLYSKVDLIQSKVGKFDLLFCVGEFFSSNSDELESYLSKEKNVPIMTYILGSYKQANKKYLFDENGCDLCDKITYLGTKGIFTTKEGLKIVYLGGVDETTIKNPGDYVKFNESDINSLESSIKQKDFDGIDILLTNQWSKYIETNAPKQQETQDFNSESFGSELISRLAFNLMPRYHFCANQNIYYERSPYHNSKIYGREIHPTFFIALAKVNKKNKPKFLYAFNITPFIRMKRQDLIQPGINATESPFEEKLKIDKPSTGGGASGSSKLKRSNEDDEPVAQYFYDAKHIEMMNKQAAKRQCDRGDGRGLGPKTHEPCWFCLGGSKIEKQYIVSISKKTYLAYAKGALNEDHLLIIPINHVQSIIQADEDILEDINLFKEGLNKYFATKNKCVVYFERNFKTQHLQIQAFGITENKLDSLKDAFLYTAQSHNIELTEIPEFTDLKQVLQPNQPYFYLELPNDQGRFLYEIKSRDFPITFGRDVIASETVLDMPERIDWKKCVKSEDEEKELTLKFRKQFAPFDPTVSKK